MASRILRAVPPVTWLAGAYLVFVFLTGGSSRDDTTSLVLLRPVAAFVTIWFAARLTPSDWRVLRVPALLAIAAIGVTALQLVPLPPALWARLPGRDILVETAAVTGQQASWRALSLVPWRTVNALSSWLVPLAAVACAASGDATHRHRLLAATIVFSLASAILGILQTLGPQGGGLYLYEGIAQHDAVGLFANRNHQALLLAAVLPLLAAFACGGVRSVEDQRRRVWMAIAAGAALVPIILVAGSRAGAILLLIAFVSVAYVYRAPRISHPAKRGTWQYKPLRVGLGVGFVALIAISFLLSRATSLTRLAATDLDTDGRSHIWARSVELVAKFFPTGSGFGTFVETYQLDEPRRMLLLTYANHAHNDWIEVLIGGGIVGALLLAAGILIWAIAAWRLWRRRDDIGNEQPAGRAGAVILLLTAVASIFDYPARTPIIAALCAFAVVWMAYAIVARYDNGLAR